MTSIATPPRGAGRALLSALRPVQWVKNGLIGVAPAAAGTITHADIIRHTAAAFVCFCALSSCLYLVNDLRDAPADRQHPAKRHRAIAAGQLPVGVAWVSAAVLFVIAFSIPFALWRPEELFLVLGIYFAISIAYTYWLKTIPIIELAAVASGFFLRAYAGAAASHIVVSTWFLVVISFGALFLVVGKRSSELKQVGAGITRPVLSEYRPEFLHSVVTLSATVVVTGYCLWAFDTSSTGLSSPHHVTVPIRLSVVPVVIAVLVIMRSVEAGDGHSAETLLYHDRTVQALAAVWAALLCVGIYG